MTNFDVVSSRDAYVYVQSSAMSGYDSALIHEMTRAESEVLRILKRLNSYLHERETSKTYDDAEVIRRDEVEVNLDQSAEVKAKL
jgi:hypothetical protein